MNKLSICPPLLIPSNKLSNFLHLFIDHILYFLTITGAAISGMAYSAASDANLAYSFISEVNPIT